MKNLQLSRVNGMLAVDRAGISESVKNAILSDVEEIIKEYAVLKGKLELNVVSDGKGFTLTLSVSGESFKGVRALY